MMTPEQQRIAIAEKDGWRVESYGPTGYENLYWRLRRPDGSVREQGCTGEEWSRKMFGHMVPNYPQDLNAMHEAEKVIPDDLLCRYHARVCDMVERDYKGSHPFSLFATASQRAEAFCRVFWPEKFKD